MRTKILIAGIAGLSLLAAAQSQSNEKKDTPKATTEVKSPRDLATGQASGRDAATGKASGKTAAADMDADGKANRTAGTGYNVKSQTKARVAAGDVNGDGVAAASSNSDGSTKGATATSREAATGMATGKRQHQPVSTSKESDHQPNK